MNVLVRGKSTPMVYLAVASVGEKIVEVSKAALEEADINILDPMASVAWSVTRTGQGKEAHYHTEWARRTYANRSRRR
jgi:hypothetical protein